MGKLQGPIEEIVRDLENNKREELGMRGRKLSVTGTSGLLGKSCPGGDTQLMPKKQQEMKRGKD